MDMNSINSHNSGSKKTAWTAEEDELLRKCIEMHGEGKWHQIPLKAGLNRCRKSCRLRWLNYLKPSIKRGEFEADEVDLIIRLHRLLGNRWSLIAGRIPGRTANDVKNYWNSHIHKKLATTTMKMTTVPNSETAKQKLPSSTHIVIKPRARIFTKNLIPFFNDQETIIPSGINEVNENPTDHHTPTINYELWPSSDSYAEPGCNNNLIITNNDDIRTSAATTDQYWWPDNMFIETSVPEIGVGGASLSSKELLMQTINADQGPWFDQLIMFAGSTGNYEVAAAAAGDQKCFQLEEGHEGNDHDHLGEISSDLHLWDFKF